MFKVLCLYAIIRVLRFHSLDRPRQRRLIEEEDQILSVVLINVTLFMAATGISPEEIQEMLYRYIAKTRVCDSEGTLLNSLIQELMRCVSEGECSSCRGSVAMCRGSVAVCRGRVASVGGV